MDNWIDRFKNFVPSEILAAFIALNSLVPNRVDIDVPVLSVATVVLVVFFIIHSMRKEKRMPLGLIALVAITLPLWFALICIERLNEHFDTDNFRVILSVSLVLIGVSLALFAPAEGNRQ